MPGATEGAAALRALAARIRKKVLAAEEKSGEDLLETAQRLSSGGLTPEDLADLGHPFARRHGTPLLPPEEVNEQSGDFKRGWTLEETQAIGGDLDTGLYNADPKAHFLQDGTERMFQRPIDDAIIAEVEPRREKRWEEALEDAFSNP